MLRPVAARLVAAVVLAAAASAVVPTAPASAAACSTAEGVTVVVDFHELGGGVQQVCDAAGGGKAAATQFAESGFTLTRVQRQPGFVCRVNGAPGENPCVNTPPTDAYWGLWWSDGTSGGWSYASQGVDSLTVPEGGYVALSWNGSSTRSPPGVSPAAHPAESTSSPSPASPSPSSPSPSSPSGGGSDPSSSPGAPGAATQPGAATASASGGPSADPSATKRAGPGDPKKGRKDGLRESGPPASASGSVAGVDAPAGPDPGSASADPAESSDGGLPPWVAPVGIAVLFAAAAGTAVVRRRRGTAGP